jgi:hypothetical protein
MVPITACAYRGRTETQHHLLLSCPLAAMVWREAGWPVAPRLSSFRDLWTSTKVHSTIVTTLLWNIWNATKYWVPSRGGPQRDARPQLVAPLRLAPTD